MMSAASDGSERRLASISSVVRLRWIWGLVIGILIGTYVVFYLLLCERIVDGRTMAPSQRKLHVRVPGETCAVFIPAACVEAVVRGCWRGVSLMDARWMIWRLTRNPWEFRREVHLE